MEGFHYLFHPVTQRALELAGDGTLGEVTRSRSGWGCPNRDADDPRWSLDLAGGALMDLGCYGLHVMRRFGAGRRWSSATAGQRSPGVDAWCDVELGFPSARPGCPPTRWSSDEYRSPCGWSAPAGKRSCTTSSSRSDDDRLTVRTDEGTSVEHHGTRDDVHLPTGGVRRPCPDGAPLPLDAADAVANMALIDEAYRAAGMKPR